jgi:hypothetical protein
MRPDKKKKQHHDSRKCKEKALKPETSTKSEENVENETSTLAENVEDVPEKELKSSKDRQKTVEEKPPKNISSNWTKFEIPSEDEDENEETMTGLNFNFAIENAGTNHNHSFQSNSSFKVLVGGPYDI